MKLEVVEKIFLLKNWLKQLNKCEFYGIYVLHF
jgi:hypothetical protein